MSPTPLKHHRILALAPSSEGFGFVVLEGLETLVDWGVKSVSGDKNVRSLAKAEQLIIHYRPNLLVLPAVTTKGSRRAARIRTLCGALVTLATRHELKVGQLSREQVIRAFFADGRGTKHALAELLAKRFPAELGDRLPPKRRPWESEDYRMDIFEAVALVVTQRMNQARRRKPDPMEARGT
jgi:hypothetical protein